MRGRIGRPSIRGERGPGRMLADDAEAARAMALDRGVAPGIADVDHSRAVALDRARGLARPGDRVVLARGAIPGHSAQDALLVREAD